MGNCLADESTTATPIGVNAERTVTSAGRVVLPLGVHPTTAINAFIEQRWRSVEAQVSPCCDDSVFVRRVYLDLTGRIPTQTEREQFIAQTDSSKRQALVNSRIDSDEFGQRMSEVFDAVLMGRQGSGKQKQRVENGWHEYLATHFNQNRPWNELVREILLARPRGDADRGAAWFLYELNDNHQDIAEAIAPGFFGVQIQCAQCHDHPLASEIEQRHYCGLVAFFNRSKNVETPRGPRVGESASGGFAKFTDLSGDASDALLTFLGKSLTVDEQRPATDPQPEKDQDEPQEENDDPESESPDLYLPPNGDDADQTPRVPRFSRRQEFVRAFVDDNPLVARAFVNRIWALLLGRGIIHPVDEMDSMHDPSHPELLNWLARDFEQSGYDVKRLVRSIVNCRAYQLDAKPLGNGADESSFAWALQKPLSAESLYRSIRVATGGSLTTDDVSALNRFRDAFPDVFSDVATTTLKQSLFLSNGTDIQSAVAFHDGNGSANPVASPDNQTAVRDAFLSAFGRSPDDHELVQCMAYMDERDGHRTAAIEQLMWALVTSAEFRFNH